MACLCLEAFCPRKLSDGNQNFENRRRFFSFCNKFKKTVTLYDILEENMQKRDDDES